MLEKNEGLFCWYFNIPNIGVSFVQEDKFNSFWEVDEIMFDFFYMFFHKLFIIAFDVEPDFFSILFLEFL